MGESMTLDYEGTTETIRTIEHLLDGLPSDVEATITVELSTEASDSDVEGVESEPSSDGRATEESDSDDAVDTEDDGSSGGLGDLFSDGGATASDSGGMLTTKRSKQKTGVKNGNGQLKREVLSVVSGADGWLTSTEIATSLPHQNTKPIRGSLKHYVDDGVLKRRDNRGDGPCKFQYQITEMGYNYLK